MAIHLTLGSKRRVPYREDAKILFQKQAVHVFVNGLPGHEKSADPAASGGARQRSE